MADHYTYIHPLGQRAISASPTVLLQLKFPYGFEEYPMMTQLDMNGDHGSTDSAQASYNLSTCQDTSTTTTPSPSLITPTDGPEVATWSSSLRPDSPHLVLPSSDSTSNQPQSRKLRKEKIRIELAADQPPTTQGRPRARVFVACLQWYAPFPSLVVWKCPSAFSLAVAARFVVTARSPCATIAHSATGTISVLTIPYRSVVDRIGSREHALVAQGRRKRENRGEGDAVPPQQSSKMLVVGHIALGGRASLPNLRQPIPWEIRLSLSIHNRAVFGPIYKTLTASKPWKTACSSARLPPLVRCSRWRLRAADTL